MRERVHRVIAECTLIAGMTEEPGRITRRFLAPPVRNVHAHLRDRMEQLGMTVSVDAAGNLRGVRQPEGPRRKRLLIGSHIDTVPDAGSYDGVLGVVLALELVQLSQEMRVPLPIEVIAFSEEEGVRFRVPFLGSRAVAGRFDPALFTLRDAEGVTLEEAIRAFGLDPGRMNEATIDDDVIGFFEVHIEQGPVLETENLSVAAVIGIVGQSRLSLEFVGQANHAGTTPMTLRRDALAAAAEMIAAVEAAAQQTQGLVATVGKIDVGPNAGNVVPGRAEISLDVRHAEDGVRSKAVEELSQKATAIAARRSLALQVTGQLDQPAVAMDGQLTACVCSSIQAAGFPSKQMFSGAGHDAMVMANRVPTTMLFLRSPGGISHSPAESVREQDVEAALRVGIEFLERIAGELR